MALRKWIDVPVFVLANVIVDIEVLVIAFLHLGRPIHRYSHTLALGAVLGAIWGVAAYLLLRRPFEGLMTLVRIRYRASLVKMVISGALGVALHVLIDGMYHFDVRVFWPSRSLSFWRTMRRNYGHERIETICLYFLFGVAVLYIHAIISYQKKAKTENAKKDE